MAKLNQYVNLPQISLFVERGITSLDRLGPVHFKAKFDKTDPMLVKFRTVLVSEVSPYTESEKKRNRSYKLQEPIGVEVSDGKEMVPGTTAQLPPSGGAVYKVEARAGDKTVDSTDEIETWRRLFFQVFRMKDASDPKKDVKVPKLKDTLDYYQTLFVELLDMPEGVKTEIPYLENATGEDLIRLVKPKYTVKDREPWVLALVFSNALPRYKELEIGAEPSTGKVSLPGRLWGNETLEFDLPNDKYVWWGMNAADDAENGGKGIWLRDDGQLTVDGRNIVIPRDSITLDTSHSYRAGKGFNRLKITLPEGARNQKRIFGKDAQLTLKLLVVGGFSGGFARRDENLLTVSRTAWWSDEDTEAEKLQVLNHELGHKLGMVPKGGRLFGGLYELDAPDKLYGDLDLVYAGPNPDQPLKNWLKYNNNAKGHCGAHCERGAKGAKQGDDWKWTGTPKCTMFGATSTADARSPQKFCEVCAKLVIRQNMDPAHSDAVLLFKSLLDS
jgi:hypothetical protein